MESASYGAAHKLHQQGKVASTPENQIQMRHTSDGETRDALRTHRISYSDASLYHLSALSPGPRTPLAAGTAPDPRARCASPRCRIRPGVGGGDSPAAAGVSPRAATNSVSP